MPIIYNDAVKQPGLQEEFTEEQVLELARCAADFNYFVSNYVYIVSLDYGRILFKPYQYQQEMFDIFNNYRFACILSSRQSGKSTTVGAYALWYSIFNKDKSIGIVSNKLEGAKDILHRIKIMYEELPTWLKPGVPEWSKTSVQFENGTKIMVAATSANSFRGRSVNTLIMDEFAFVPKGQAEEFWASNYPTISSSPNSQVIIISTPNGMYNLFHEMYTQGRDKLTRIEYDKACAKGKTSKAKFESKEKGGIKNEFVTAKFDWACVPGRDDEWAEVQRKNLGDQKFNQEFAVEFLGSTSTLIDPMVLKKLFEEVSGDTVRTEMGGKLRYYELPRDGATYIIGVDPSKGTGKHDSVIQVVRIDSINPIQMEQVAVFQDNKTDPYHFTVILNRLSNYYNNATMFVENNGEGAPVVHHIWYTFENENLYCESAKKNGMGVRATKQTKSKAVTVMKKLVEDFRIKINDRRTLRQLSTFIEHDNGTFSGQDGVDDDLVSGFYWACFAMELDLFDDDVKLIDANDYVDDTWGLLSDVEDYSSGINWEWV